MKSYGIVWCVLLLCVQTIGTLPPFADFHTGEVQKKLKSMSRQEKIGQLFMVAAASNFDQPTESLASALQACPYRMDQEYIEWLIERYHIGGVIFLFKSDPATQIKVTKRFQAKAKHPLLIGQDCEWGLGMRLDIVPNKVVQFPHNMTLGALAEQHEHLVYQLGNEIGKQCAALGIHINFAPVVDVNNNPENLVIHDRSFGDNQERVGRLAALYAQGLQDAGVIACAKHFPGHGDTSVDSHVDLPVIKHDRKRLGAVELMPFKELIKQGVGAVMTAHISIPALDATPNKPSSFSCAVINDCLHKECGFQGLTITDGLGMKAITNHYQPGDLELQALLAGNDMLLCPLDVPKAVQLIEQALEDGRLTEEALDTHVFKILQAKEWACAQQQVRENPEQFLIRADAYRLQKLIYQNAITVMKNNETISFDSTLIDTSYSMYVGTNPLERVYAYRYKQCDAQLSDDERIACIKAAESVDTVIVLIGSINKIMQQQWGIAENSRRLVHDLKKRGKNVIVVLFGTPYSISLFEAADVFIVAYEDVPIAHQAVCNVLIGVEKATGRLPIAMS